MADSIYNQYPLLPNEEGKSLIYSNFGEIEGDGTKYPALVFIPPPNLWTSPYNAVMTQKDASAQIINLGIVPRNVWTWFVQYCDNQNSDFGSEHREQVPIQNGVQLVDMESIASTAWKKFSEPLANKDLRYWDVIYVISINENLGVGEWLKALYTVKDVSFLQIREGFMFSENIKALRSIYGSAVVSNVLKSLPTSLPFMVD